MINLEKAAANDAEAIYNLEQAVGTKEFILPYSLEQHLANIKAGELIYLKVLHSGNAVGFIILALDESPDAVELRRVVIGDKGRGFGQQAIRTMEAYCSTTLGRNTVWLDVFEDNRAARHIYEKLGYQQFGETETAKRKLLFYRKQL